MIWMEELDIEAEKKRKTQSSSVLDALDDIISDVGAEGGEIKRAKRNEEEVVKDNEEEEEVVFEEIEHPDIATSKIGLVYRAFCSRGRAVEMTVAELSDYMWSQGWDLSGCGDAKKHRGFVGTKLSNAGGRVNRERIPIKKLSSGTYKLKNQVSDAFIQHMVDGGNDQNFPVLDKSREKDLDDVWDKKEQKQKKQAKSTKASISAVTNYDKDEEEKKKWRIKEACAPYSFTHIFQDVKELRDRGGHAKLSEKVARCRGEVTGNEQRSSLDFLSPTIKDVSLDEMLELSMEAAVE